MAARGDTTEQPPEGSAEVAKAKGRGTALAAAEKRLVERRAKITLLEGKILKLESAQPLKQRERRIRHFTSLRLAKGAPIDEIVARFLALDSLEEVRSVELGTNAAPDSSESRGHHLALMVTFAGGQQRARYLASAARAEFLSFIEPFVADTFAIDFESGLVQ